MTTVYLAGRYIFQGPASPEGRSDGDLTVSARSKIAVRHSIKWHEVKLPSYSVHAYVYNEIEQLMFRFLVKHTQFPSRAEVPPR